MSKITFFVLLTIAASLRSAYASEEDKAAVREALKPVVALCAQEHGVSDEEIQNMKKAGSAEGIKPCFLGCVFKNTGIFTPTGEYDVNTGLAKLRKFVKTDTDYTRFAEIGQQCAEVNQKPVSDGAAGCERAALLLSCFFEHDTKFELPV